MNPPFYYDHLNIIDSSVTPSSIHVHDSYAARLFKRYLIQEAMSVFKWELPEEWAENYFLYTLYSYGYIAVFNDDKVGVIPQHCGLGGYDVFYRPAWVQISSPILGNFRKSLTDDEAVLFHLQPDYCGIMDIVNYYGDLLALCLESAGLNIANSKLVYAFFAENKSTAESFKKMFDQASSGEPAVFADSKLLKPDGSPSWSTFFNNLSQNYIASEILVDMRKIKNEFDTVVGIPNANSSKRERLISNEVEANNVETSSKCEMWLESLQKACERANAIFGTKIGVSWRVEPDRGY